MAQRSDRLGFRVRDSTLRANVSKASRRSPSPMLESVPRDRRRGRRPPPAGARGRQAAGGSAKPCAAWVSWMRPTAPGPSAAFTRSRRSGTSICSCGACAPLTATVSSPPAGPRARASLHRRADRGELRAGDLRPERPQPRLGEAPPRGGGAHLRLDQPAGPHEAAPRAARRGLAFPAAVCHCPRPCGSAPGLTLTRLTARRRGLSGGTDRGRGRARRSCSPGTTARPAPCPGARRRAPARRPDPYAVWLSEVMLQQTTVAAVARLLPRPSSPAGRRSRRWPRPPTPR